jgi:predicted enzyme related to lactoylglutathione lyase
MSNPVVHFEVVGKDAKKLGAYYSSLFGWNVDANNPMNYGMVAAGEGGIAGGIGEGESNLVTFYVQVDDPQKYLDQAVKLGGKVVMPVMAIPGAVTMAQFSDPEGHVIGLVKA